MVTYSNAEAGDAFLLTLDEDTFSQIHVVRLAIGDHHHHFGRSIPATTVFVKSPLTDQSSHMRDKWSMLMPKGLGCIYFQKMY